MTDANPFEVLRLDPAATEEEIVQQAGWLRQRVGDEDALAAVRRAVQALTARPDDRLLFALLTHPRPAHSVPELDRLATACRRPPAAEGPARPPPLDLAEAARLLAALAAEELETPPPPFEPVAADEGADEVRRQRAEALWQALLFDFRA
jgi:hypothetical protein